jgi:hypothetical protein
MVGLMGANRWDSNACRVDYPQLLNNFWLLGLSNALGNSRRKSQLDEGLEELRLALRKQLRRRWADKDDLIESLLNHIVNVYH